MGLEHGHVHHGHDHGMRHGSGRLAEARRVTIIGAGLRIVQAGLELWVGIAFQSRALIADTVHTLSDVISDAIVWVALRFADKPADATFPFGRGKVETLAALAIALLLASAAVFIAVEAGAALARGQGEPPSTWGALAALVGVLVQEFSFRWTRRVGERLQSPALIANAWHHRSDALSSVAVLLGIGGGKLFNAWWLDPVAAMVVAGMILRVGLRILRESARGLVDASVPPEIRERITSTAVADVAVVEVHDVRARHVGPAIFVDLHAVVHPQMTVVEACAVAGRIENAVKAAVNGVQRVLVHVEPAREGVILPPPRSREA